MKIMARILIAILVIAMMFSVVGCGNTTQNVETNNGETNNGESDIGNGVNNNENDSNVDDTQQLQDIEYTPSLENLIGVAVYPVVNGTYPYQEGEKLSWKERGWKSYYIKHDSDGYMRNNDYDFEEDFVSGENEVFVKHCNSEMLVWGYVYQVNNEVFIIATHDIVSYQENPATFDFSVQSGKFTPWICHFSIEFTTNQ